jgi:hypothetical protein
LFYNAQSESIIVVCVSRIDNFSQLHCKSIALAHVAKRKPELGVELFADESLQWPGFVEFDQVNGKILTYSAVDHVYKSWDLGTYRFLYSFSDWNVDEVKVSPGIVMLVHKRAARSIQLKIMDIESGKEAADFTLALRSGKPVQFVEQFQGCILIKQQTHALRIVNVATQRTLQVPESVFPTPSAFAFLHEKSCFLTFCASGAVQMWNARGERLAAFANHHMISAGAASHVTESRELLMGICVPNKASSSSNSSSSNRSENKEPAAAAAEAAFCKLNKPTAMQCAESNSSSSNSGACNSPLPRVQPQDPVTPLSLRSEPPRQSALQALVPPPPGSPVLMRSPLASLHIHSSPQAAAATTEPEAAAAAAADAAPAAAPINDATTGPHELHISDLLSGQSVAVIGVTPAQHSEHQDDDGDDDGNSSSSSSSSSSSKRALAAQIQQQTTALTGVTTIFYDDNVIITGNEPGKLCVWGLA